MGAGALEPCNRSIPAWAGETDDLHWFGGNEDGLSPRGRGNRLPIFPTANRVRVYPRVGGGTVCGLMGASKSTGLSPRGRGEPG